MIETTQLPRHGCPVCLRPFDAATNITGDAKPQPGDLTICLYCTTVLEFDAEMRPQELSPARRAAVPMEQWRVIERMRLVIAMERAAKARATNTGKDSAQ